MSAYVPCLHLPVNARISLVALCRPLTFLVALSFSLLAFATSTFYSLSGLDPLECRCPTADKSPRTRPRPRSTSVPPIPPAPTHPSPLESFSSFVTSSFRPHRPPPVARRGSGNKISPYPLHELDEVAEEEDGEEAEENGEFDEPGLTPDVSEGDDSSSLETLDDHHAHVVAPNKKPRSKGFRMLSNLKWKKNSSEEGSMARQGSTSSTDSQRATSMIPSPNSDFSPVTPSAFVSTSSRPRSATSSSATPRTVRFSGRKQTSLDSVSSTDSNESLEGPGIRSRKPLSVSTSSAQAHPLLSKASFRSLSPLSRSPITTPEPSPPPSPKSTSCPFSRHIATRLQRSHSLDSPSQKSRKTRSVSPLPKPAPQLRRGSSAIEGLGLDSTGSSGLKLDDLLR